VTQTVDQFPRTAGHPADSGASPEHPHAEHAHAGHAHPAYPVYVAAPPSRFATFMLRMWARFPRWTAPTAILACFASAAAFVWYWEPTDGAFDQTTCLLKLTTGFDCPGCGGTRAFFYLTQGNLPAAARHHLMFVFAVPFLAYMYLAWAGKLMFGWRLPQLRVSPTTISIFLAAAGVFSVLRNLPWAPFNWFYV
jgi:hypothetical protein